MAGAGGIGGLLARYRHAPSSPYGINGASLYHADGNGNVTALMNGAGSLQASYRYDPFGRWLSGGGSLATANTLRFSSKPWVAFASSTTSGLYYYGYRFYDPFLQRWVNRDPIGEEGGLNLYIFVNNMQLNATDSYGLRKWCGTCDMGGAGWVIGFHGLICDLTSPCPNGKGHEFIHVRATFFTATAGLPDLPGVTAVTFRTCFEVPDGFDTKSSFSGAARFVSGTVAIGRGRSLGKIVLGYAESEGWTSVSGFDLGAGFGSGFSWLEGHTDCDCR